MITRTRKRRLKLTVFIYAAFQHLGCLEAKPIPTVAHVAGVDQNASDVARRPPHEPRVSAAINDQVRHRRPTRHIHSVQVDSAGRTLLLVDEPLHARSGGSEVQNIADEPAGSLLSVERHYGQEMADGYDAEGTSLVRKHRAGDAQLGRIGHIVLYLVLICLFIVLLAVVIVYSVERGIDRLAAAAYKQYRGGDPRGSMRIFDKSIDPGAAPIKRQIQEILTSDAAVKQMEQVFQDFGGRELALTQKQLDNVCANLTISRTIADSGEVQVIDSLDHAWVRKNWTSFFPPRKPLDRDAFIDLFQLIVFWRIAVTFFRRQLVATGRLGIFSRQIQQGDSFVASSIRVAVRYPGNESPTTVAEGDLQAFAMVTGNLGFREAVSTREFSEDISQSFSNILSGLITEQGRAGTDTEGSASETPAMGVGPAANEEESSDPPLHSVGTPGSAGHKARSSIQTKKKGYT